MLGLNKHEGDKGEMGQIWGRLDFFGLIHESPGGNTVIEWMGVWVKWFGTKLN